jgi:hypothetical protein
MEFMVTTQHQALCVACGRAGQQRGDDLGIHLLPSLKPTHEILLQGALA